VDGLYFNWLNRGVVLGTVMEQVSSASRLDFLDGRAKGVKADSAGSVDVEVERGDGASVALRPGLEVDASGFEPWCQRACTRPQGRGTSGVAYFSF
jgi:hypothetical protein